MVIFFDIDGTLIPYGASDIPDSAKAAIRAAQKRGHLALINTGRTIANIEPNLRHFGFDGIVSGCGMMAILHGRTLWQMPTDPICSRRVIGSARAFGVKAHYEGYAALAFDVYAHPLTEEESAIVARMREHQKKVILLGEEADFPIVKFLIDRAYGGDIDGFRAEFPEYQFIRIDDRWTECVPVGASKGAALVRTMEALGLPLAESIAVGDSENDKSMLDACPNSVAIGGTTAAEFDVSYVTPPIGEDAIARMIEHFGLCG